MESVLLKAKFGKFKAQAITGSIFDGQKGMSDREGQGHWAVLYKSHFPATKALQYIYSFRDTSVYIG